MIARELFRRLHERHRPVRLIGVKLGGLVSGVALNFDLFDNNEKCIKLYLSMGPNSPTFWDQINF